MESCKMSPGCECAYCEYIDLQNSMSTFKGLKPSIQSEENLESVIDLTLGNSALFRQWHYVFTTLRILGSCPLILEARDEKPKWRMSFRWICWTSFYTLIVDILRIGLILWYFWDWGLFVLGRAYENGMRDWIFRIINVSLPVHQLWNILMVWVTSGRVANLCNAWFHFELRYRKIFSDGYAQTSTLISRIQKWRWSLGVLLGTCGIGLFSTVFAETVGDYQAKIGYNHVAIRCLINTGFQTIAFLDEVKTLLMYFSLSEGFVNVRLGIKNQIKDCQVVPDQVVSKWTQILQELRRNVALTGNAQTPVQIPALLQTILLFTLISFTTLQSAVTSDSAEELLVSFLIATAFVVRVFLKIKLAEDIVAEEEVLANFLIEIDPALFSLKGKLELCKIVETLQQKPSKMSLNGYVIVEKKVIPKMMGQVVSYLVVLIQFHLGYYVNKDRALNCS